MHAELIAIGDELTSGQRLDTNSRWMAAELGVLGIPVTFHTTVPDTMEAGIEAFRLAAARAPLVMVTGGLGPTADDLTRDVLAAVAGVPLDLSEDVLATVESRFSRRGMPMPESNRRQAMFPRGSRIIPNPEGTAPGIDIDLPRPTGGVCRVFALPGVPAEMKVMWSATVDPAVLAMLPDRATIIQRRIKCFGAGESAIEAMLPDLIRRGRDPLVGITAHEATITLRIAARGRDEAECVAKMAPTAATIHECLGTLAYGVEDDEIEDAVLAAVVGRGRSLATAESGTAGRVAALLAQADARRGAAGSVFRGGTVTPTVGDVRGAAEDARTRFAATVGLAVGDVRPTVEGRRAVDVAIADADGVATTEHVFGGAADLAPTRAAKSAINLVRLRMLEGARP